jgi:hypothetical protein
VGHDAAAQREAVDEDRPLEGPEQRQSAVQSLQIAFVQTAAVDRGRRARHDGQPPRPRHDAGEELLATHAGQLLGIVQGLERDEVGVGPAGVVEGDGGRHERPRQAAAPGLVGARHGAAGAALQVVGKARVHEGTLSAGARQGKPRRVTGQ